VCIVTNLGRVPSLVCLYTWPAVCITSAYLIIFRLIHLIQTIKKFTKNLHKVVVLMIMLMINIFLVMLEIYIKWQTVTAGIQVKHLLGCRISFLISTMPSFNALIFIRIFATNCLCISSN